jgi:hypothetical protein
MSIKINGIILGLILIIGAASLAPGIKNVIMYPWTDLKFNVQTPVGTQIPELPRVALPLAVVIGSLFMLQNRKNKEE